MTIINASLKPWDILRPPVTRVESSVTATVMMELQEISKELKMPWLTAVPMLVLLIHQPLITRNFWKKLLIVLELDALLSKIMDCAITINLIAMCLGTYAQPPAQI